MKKVIQVGVENENTGFQRFIDAWSKIENDDVGAPEYHLNFEDFDLLLSVLNSNRLNLLRCLKKTGPLSIRGLSRHVDRDYKNVHTDVKTLEKRGLITRDEKSGLLVTPWDAINAHVELAG